ncbi:MAG: hypothetical protein ACLUB2_02110 [Butyricicoccus pullicaecorum]
MKKNKFVVVGSGSSYTPAIVAVLLAQGRPQAQRSRSVRYRRSRVARTGQFCELYAREHAQGVPVSTPPTSKPHFAALISCSFRSSGCNQQREKDEKSC